MLAGAATDIFNNKVAQRGNAILDEIFVEKGDVRNNVKLKNPRYCGQREVTFMFNYSSKDEAQEIVLHLAEWLGCNNNYNKLNPFITY